MDFSKYTSYFHDGDVFDVYQKIDQIAFWMESAQIPPEEMIDDIALTNFSTLRGQLHLEGIKCIYENDEIVEDVKKQYDFGNIHHLEIKESFMLILISWQTDVIKNRKNSDVIEYKIEAEKIYWKNLPMINSPTHTPIDDYQEYFINGKIFRIGQDKDRDRIILVIESIPIPENINSVYNLTENNTIKKEFILTWPKEIKVNGSLINVLEPIVGEGEILKFSIGHHCVKLDVRWLSVTDGSPGNSPIMRIEIECGAIDVRQIPVGSA